MKIVNGNHAQFEHEKRAFRPLVVHSTQLKDGVYTPQGGTEKSALLLRVLICCGELQLW